MSALVTRPWDSDFDVDVPHPNSVAQRITGRGYLSYSAVSTYQACPLRYYFRYVAGLPEKTIAATLVYGKAIHGAVEHHFRELLHGSPPPSSEALFETYAAGWLEHVPDTVRFNKTDDRQSLDNLARRMLVAFQASDLAAPRETILGIEEELIGNLIPGVPDILARIDLLTDVGDAIVITDLKTAKSRWSEEQAKDASGQLLLYHDLIKPLADGRPIRLEFAVLTKSKVPELIRQAVPFTQRQVDRTKRIVARVWAGIDAGLFFPSPSALNCPSCPFRRQCDAWPA